jgi:hypothetical protein
MNRRKTASFVFSIFSKEWRAILKIKHIELKQANEYVEQNHRHHKKVACHRFSLACYDGERLCGAAIVGRPVARALDQFDTVEVLRLCTDGTRNACSALYGACRRAAKVLGYSRIITYILESESGASLKASGWKYRYATKGGEWDTPSRRRETKAPACPKKLYDCTFEREQA